MASDEARLIELESKIAYQDDTLLKLNDVVTRQQQQIDRMELNISELTRRLKDLAESASNIQVQDEKPPHY